MAAILAASLLASTCLATTASPASAAEETYRLWAGNALESGERLVSPEAAFTLEMQASGDLVEFDAGGNEVWSSATTTPGSALEMGDDGNAVVSTPDGLIVWESGTAGSGAHTIEVQDDGNVVLYAPGHAAVWSTGVITNGGSAGPASPGGPVTPHGGEPLDDPVAADPGTGSEGGAGARPDGGTPPSPDGHESFIRCTISGTEGDDQITGTRGNDVLCGQGGDDTITGGGGFDDIYGGDGNDDLSGNDTVQTLDGAALVASGEPIGDQIWGDNGNDSISGGDGKDQIEAGPGADRVDAGAGDDRVAGDRFIAKAGDPDGDDDIRTGAGNDSVTAGAGNDVVIDAANTVQDIIDGDAGDDAIIGLAGFSSNYDGGPGNDLLYPAAARLNPLGNSVRGGDGNDIAILLNRQGDGFTRGTHMETIGVPVSRCQLTVPVAPENYDKTSELKFGCPVLGPVDLEVNGDGTPSLSSDLFSESTSLNPADWRGVVLDKTGQLQGDLCVCDQVGIPAVQEDRVY